MALDKNNKSETAQYKEILGQLYQSIEKDNVTNNIEKWTNINKLSRYKNLTDFWKEMDKTKTTNGAQFPTQIQNREGKTIKDKQKILKEAINTLQQITELKDKEAIKFQNEHGLSANTISNNKKKL